MAVAVVMDFDGATLEQYDQDRVAGSHPCRAQREVREIAAEIVGQREGE